MIFDCWFFFSSRRRHTRCALVTGVQTCALPIYGYWSLGNWSGWAAWDMLRLNPDAELPEGWSPVEPPANVQRLYELRSTIPTTVGEEQATLMNEFTALLAEEFLTIGIANPAGYYRSRSEERRVGKKGVITCSSRRRPYH